MCIRDRGLTVAGQMTADKFVQPDTLLILALGLVAFVFDTVGGVLFAKLLNLFLPEGKKINPMIGAAGISAFPMSGRVVNQMGLAEDNQNFLLMYSISVNAVSYTHLDVYKRQPTTCTADFSMLFCFS